LIHAKLQLAITEKFEVPFRLFAVWPKKSCSVEMNEM
jgi:hypothetical protein